MDVGKHTFLQYTAIRIYEAKGSSIHRISLIFVNSSSVVDVFALADGLDCWWMKQKLKLIRLLFK